MIFPLSLIIVFGGTALSLYLTISNSVAWYFCILIALGTFLLTVGIFCLIIMLLLVTLGHKLSKTYNPKGKFRWFFMTDVARFSCFWLGVRIKAHGLEKLPKDTNFVIYSNHQSYLDMFILYLVFKDYPHATMYKKIIDTYPLASGMAKALGGIPIDREDDKEALKVILKIISEVKIGLNFLVFPEGTRSKGLYMHKYKAGSFKISEKAMVPTVLVAIDGSYQKKMTIPFIRTPIYVNIVEVIDPSRYQEMNTQELASLAHDLVEADINKARTTYRYLKPAKKYLNKNKWDD